MICNPAKPKTNAALKRENERLKAQVKALQEMVQRIAGCDTTTVLENADMRVKMKQAADILAGRDV